jgi:hypothetical protein
VHLHLLAIFLASLLGPPPEDGEVRIVDLSGTEMVLSSLTIDATGKVRAKKDETVVDLDLRNIRSISFVGREASLWKSPALFLAGGGVLLGKILEADARVARFDSPLIQEVAMPLAGIRGFRLSPATEEDPTFRSRMETDGGEDSIFVMREGNLLRVPGAFRSLDAETLSLVWEDQEKTVPRSAVYGVVLSGGNAPGDGRSARILLTDGSRIEGEIRGMDKDHLLLRLPIGAEIVAWGAGVVRIDVLSDRLVFLSDREPEKVEEVPYFNTVWPYRKDRSLDGNPIRLGGKTYEKGLGVHSRCLLTYDLRGEFETFSAVIGIDDETRELGHVVFRVHADGETLFDSGDFAGSDEPRRITLDVRDRAKLVLEVDFGKDLDIGDHADWADAHLVRKS